jgi:DNA helicase HerA-like ATPase
MAISKVEVEERIKENESLFRPLLILGDTASGKTFLVKKILSKLISEGWSPEDIHVVSHENEYGELGVDWSNKLRKRDVWNNGKVIVLEDLPAYANKRTFKILRALLTQGRHLKSYVIATSQDDEGIDWRLLRRFKAIVFFRNQISYNKWWKAFRKEVASFLVERVERLDDFRFIILDRESRIVFNEYANDEEEGVSLIVEGLREKLTGGISLKELREVKQEVKVKKSQVIIKNSKKDKAKELMLSGLTDAEICKELGISSGTLQVYRHQFYVEDEGFRKRYLELKAKRGLKAGRPVEAGEERV